MGHDSKGYDFALDDMEPGHQQENEEAFQEMTAEEKRKAENELLFWVQGIGAIKKIGKGDDGATAYVKADGCEDCIREIIKLLKFESSSQPFYKQTLGKWNTLKNDLLPLFMFHTQDKKLSFQTLLLFVQLTELPHKDCNEKARRDIFK